MAYLSTWNYRECGPAHDDGLCRWDAIPDDALEDEEDEGELPSVPSSAAAAAAAAPPPPASHDARRAAKLRALRRRLQESIPLSYVVHRLLPGEGISLGHPMRSDIPASRVGAVPPSLQPTAAAVWAGWHQRIVVCGGLAPASARALTAKDLAAEAAAARPPEFDAEEGRGPRARQRQRQVEREREDAPDASRAFRVQAACPSASATVLVGSRLGVIALPLPPQDALFNGSHGHSLAAAGRNGDSGVLALFGGHVTAGATPSARELMLDPNAARQDAAHNLTNAMQVLAFPHGMFEGRRWIDGNEQSGSAPGPRAMHSAAFARPPPEEWIGGPSGDRVDPRDALSLRCVHVFRQDFEGKAAAAAVAGREQQQQQQQRLQQPWSAAFRRESAKRIGAVINAERPDAIAARPLPDVSGCSPIECALAHEAQLCDSLTWRNHGCMYVFGGVRLEGGGNSGAAGGGNPLDARRRVPADREAGTLYALVKLEERWRPSDLDSGVRDVKWHRLGTTAAPGQPRGAVPNTTTLLAFWASADGCALYAVPDRLAGGGGAAAGGGGGGYALHRLCLHDLTWQLVAVQNGGGGACAGPEPRVGAAAVFLLPGADEAPYSGGRLVVYGGRRVAGGGSSSSKGGPTGAARAGAAAAAAAAAAADLHVLHLPPDGALAREGSLARRAYEAARAGELPPRSQAGRLAARRLREREREGGGAAVAAAAWWEAVAPELYPPPSFTARAQAPAAGAGANARNSASGAGVGGRRPAPSSAPESPAMLPLWQHAGAAWCGAGAGGRMAGGWDEEEDDQIEDGAERSSMPSSQQAAAVFVGGADAGASPLLGPPSTAVQVLRLSVARPPGAPPGGSAEQRLVQHARRAIAVLLLRAARRRRLEAAARRQAAGRPPRPPPRQVALRAAGAGEGAAAITASPELLALYSDLFDEQFQGLLGGSDDEDEEEEDEGEGVREGGGNGAPPPPRPPLTLPVPVASDDALLNVLCWAQGRLSLWALSLRELHDLYVAADALAMPRLMEEARRGMEAALTERERWETGAAGREELVAFLALLDGEAGAGGGVGELRKMAEEAMARRMR